MNEKFKTMVYLEFLLRFLKLELFSCFKLELLNFDLFLIYFRLGRIFSVVRFGQLISKMYFCLT